MKIRRDFFIPLLAISLFLGILQFLTVVSTLHPVHHQFKLFHKTYIKSEESSGVVSVDLFERTDDSHRYVPIPPYIASGSPILLLILTYVLMALYVASVFIPYHKISFDCLWQKSITSL